MLWQHYVFRRGTAVSDMWDRFFRDRSLNILYIGGRGFDPRAQTTVSSFVRSVFSSGARVAAADLLLVGLARYELDDELKAATEENATFLRSTFSGLGETAELIMDTRAEGEDELSTSNALRRGVEDILTRIPGRTDIILDVSSLPRVAYLARIIHSASIFGSIFGADRNLRLLLGAAGHFRCGAEVREERFAG